MTIDKHTLALISIVGSSLDVLGALYLAYDLLGGEHGPLRTLSRGVTYGALFGAGYGLALGPVFGLASGMAHGITLAWEFSRASRHKPKPGIWYDAAMSAIRGAGFALGTAYLYGMTFGATLGALSTMGQIVAYRAGIRPTLDYQPAARPRLTKYQFLAAVNRAVGYGAAGYISALVAGQRATALGVGVKIGLALGLVTAIAIACTSFIEWIVDTVPEKRMGVVGVGLILIGFTLQSVQYWMALLDVGSYLSRPELMDAVHDNLRNLGLDRLDVVNLRVGGVMGPSEGSIAEPLTVLAELKRQGLIRHLGLSNVYPAQLAEAQKITEIVCVQNFYNVAHRNDDGFIDDLAGQGIAYVPFFPLGGFTPLQSSALDRAAASLQATPMQVALAWLLQRSPNILLIPGTSSAKHLRENLQAATLQLPPEMIAELSSIGGREREARA